jgi:hypothetical protein
MEVLAMMIGVPVIIFLFIATVCLISILKQE